VINTFTVMTITTNLQPTQDSPDFDIQSLLAI